MKLYDHLKSNTLMLKRNLKSNTLMLSLDTNYVKTTMKMKLKR